MAPLHSTTLCAAVVSVLQCHSQSTGPGNDGCPCNDPQIGTNINFRIDCPQGFGTGWADAMLSDWSYCLAATVLAETEAYQPTYGIGCQKHYEPGDAACFDQATNMELAVADRASWCDDQWCYVDPCDCNSEASQSARFAGASYAYSYVTCGSADAFAATVVGGTESADCAAGQGGCPCSDPLLGSSNYRMTCPQDFGTGWAVAPSTTYCVQATVSNVLVAYAPTYGVGCQKHYEPGAAACFDQATNMELAVADRASWCDDQWCYVDPCNCNSVVSQSLYFAGASYAYSYVTCGSVDAFEATVTGGTEPAECAAGQAGCPCSDPQLGSNANYNINCPQGFGSGWADAVLSTWTYCVQATISGVDTANAVTAAYPPTYGVGCQKHYEPGSSDCFNQVADAELPDADRASWCDNQWCYVDPCNCNADVSQSSYFAGASYAYSYATCGSADEFAATVGGTSTGVCVPTCGTAGNNAGTEMANMPVNAADACACSTLCASTAGCAGYTFVGSSTSCYLRSSWGASVDNVATAVSAQQSSPSPSPTPATCGTAGNNAGTEMASMPVNAATACACSTLCASTTGCAGYTFVGSSTSCYLRSSWGASVDNVATAVSAQQSSPSPSPTPATCGTAGNNAGTEMASMPVNSASACACSTLCASTTGCAGYTFVGSSTSCYLRSSWGASVDNVATAVSAQQSSPSPSPTPASPTPTPPAYTCPTGGRNIQLSDLVQGAPFNECICIGDWNTKDYNDEIHVVPKLATGCCPIGSVPGTQATANYQGAQIVCGFTPDGSVNLNINTAFACDYEQCYVDRQNIPCADGSSVRLNGCCAGSPSGSGDVTDTARLAFADSASCLGYAYEIFTVHSFTDLFEYCTHYNSVYSSGTDVGTALVSDDVDAAEAGFNTDNYATYARCVGGSVEDTDSSGVGRFGLSMCIVGIAGLAL